MTKKTTLPQVFAIVAALVCLGFADIAVAQRQMESLTRGVTVVPMSEGGHLVSWRLFGNDPDTIAFNVYRTAADGIRV